MDQNASEDSYNSLKEMILDESKLVTYASLSKDLCIHVNDSKRLLGQFIEDLKKSQPDITLNVYYVVSGLTEGNNALTTVCSQEDIASVRQKLRAVFFEHIYSVRKGSSSVDNVALMSVNRFEDFPLCTGLIKSNTCIKHSTNEISSLKSNSQEVVVIDSKLTNTKTKNKIDNHEHTKPVNGERSNNIKISDAKQNSIKSEVTSPKSEKRAIEKSNKGIASFFNKSNGVKKPKSEPNLPNVVKKEIVEKPVIKKETPIEVKEEKVKVDKEEQTKGEPKPKANDSKAKNKNLNIIKKNAKVDKKRKRVLQVSDSESDDDKDDPFADSPAVNIQQFESDDEIPPTPTVSTVKITSGIVNPKKKRKMVDKTYDEDGYILTKKEEVYESCSDNEMEVDAKENKVNQIKVEVSPSKKTKIGNSPSKKPNGKKKVSPTQKGKQATLMSFFKKV